MKDVSLLHPLRPIRRRHIALLRQVASVQHRVLDQSTALGYLWSFLNPLLMLLVLWAFYGRGTNASLPNFAVYLLVGLVHFTHFSKSVAAAMRALHRMRSLATSVIFPKDVLVYSAILADLPEYLISVALTTAIALATGVPPSWALLALPLIVAAELLLVVWVSLVLSVLYVFVRDLDHLFEVGMRLLFFATPIIYRLDSLPTSLRRIALANPLAHLVEYARAILLDGHVPAEALLGFLVLNLLLAYVGLIIFRRSEAALLERL